MQAVLKQFGGGGYGISDSVITDEAELQQYRRIEQLYMSTRSSKVSRHLTFCFPVSVIYLMNTECFFQHFQRDIVRGVEGFIVTGSKQVEIGISLELLVIFPSW